MEEKKKKCIKTSKRPSRIDSHPWLHLRITWRVFKTLDTQAAHEVNYIGSQGWGAERGQRAKRQSFLQLLSDFSVLPGLASAALRVLRRFHQLLTSRGAWQALLKQKPSLKISQLQPVTQSSSLSRVRITGFVDLAKGVVMVSEEILSTSHHVSIITLPRLDFKHVPIILPWIRYGAPDLNQI